MPKFSSNVLRYGCYQNELNQVRRTLFNFRISQEDFARYLHLDTKSVSWILNGKTVPNAALWSYIRHILSDYECMVVLMRYLEKHGKSSLSCFRKRSLVLIDFPLPF